MKEKKNIVFLGSSGFPYVKEASITRIFYLGQTLLKGGHNVLIINRKGRYNDKGNDTQLDPKGSQFGIDFIYTSGNAKYSTNFTKRNLSKIKGLVNEIKLLYSLKKQKKLDYAFIYTQFFSAVVLYRLLSKIIGFKVVINIVEYFSMIEAKKSISKKINDYFYDNYNSYLGDGFIPISDLLVSNLVGRNKNKYLKIPPIFDYSIFEEIEKRDKQNPKYFLFCGGAGFYEIIKLIVDSFRAINKQDLNLYLVSNGAPHYVKRLQELIKDDPQIKLYQNLSNEDLYDLYLNAYALLIPLRNTLQDTARFPNKISEYLATRNPIITTNFGEIPKFFENGKNAFVADQFSIESYSKQLIRSIESPELSKKIGENGYHTGKIYFAYDQYVGSMEDFLNRL